jgi:hypothetical protein
VLTGIGVATARKSSSGSQWGLVLIPFLFALQQLSEGILWIGLSNHWEGCGWQCVARYAFLILAFCTWPWLFSLSLSFPEPNSLRKKMICGVMAMGILLCSYNFYHLLSQGIGAQIINHSIQYTNTMPSEGPLYLFVVCAPWFISSLRHAWICGVIGLIAFTVTGYFYWETFTSVWCFFAALISVIIYFIVRDAKLGTKKT